MIFPSFIEFSLFTFRFMSTKITTVPITMAVRNVELVHECFLKHSRMGTSRMKYYNEKKKVREE